MKWINFYGEKGDEYKLDHAYSFTLLKFRGWSVRFHKFVATDESGYHSHPATAFRLVLKGGYVEELPNGTRRAWRPGMFGLVETGFYHRIAELPKGKSYSLWIRAPHTEEVDFIERDPDAAE